MMVRRTFFLSTGLLALVGLSGAAGAAAAPPGGQGGGLDSLYDSLRLRPDQEGAWRAYVAAVTPSQSAENRRRAAAMLASTLDTPRRVDLINAEMEADLAELRRQGDAVKSFYGALDADQKRTFDRLTLRQPQEDEGGPPFRGANARGPN
jgi:hypothetical protein